MGEGKELSRRDFVKKVGIGTAVAVTIADVTHESGIVRAEVPSTTLERRALISALGDTLIPSGPDDPGYRNLEWYGITEEVLKEGLSDITENDLAVFNRASAPLFEGRNFLELNEKDRAVYIQHIIAGDKFPDQKALDTLQSVYRTVRRRIFTVFWTENFPESVVPRDIHDIPLLKPGDQHQITNPNTERLVTGWDIARYSGPLTFEEEERRRERAKKIDWQEEESQAQDWGSESFKTQEDFTKALLSAGSKGNPSSKYDVVIVGGGMAGCILAARIAEKGVNPRNGERLRVAMIEWGPYLKGSPKPGYGHPLRRLLFTHVAHEFQRSRIGSRYLNPWTFGKMVGGSTLHYGAQAFTPFDEDYLHWQNETGVDWTKAAFKEAVEEVRTMFNVHPIPEEFRSEGDKRAAEAAKKLGYSVDQMSFGRKNCIYCVMGTMCKYDAKVSMLVNYVPIAEANGVEIIPNTRVEKIIIEKKGSDFVATGVEAVQDGNTVRFVADKVILCASVNANPLILWNSGYGPKDMVKDLLIENPNVGRHVDGKLRVSATTTGIFAALFPFPLADGEFGGAEGSYYFFDQKTRDGYDQLLFKGDFSGSAADPSSDAFDQFAPEFGWDHKQFMKTRGWRFVGTGGSTQYKAPNHLEGQIGKDGWHKYPVVNDPKIAKRLIEGLAIDKALAQTMGAVKMSNLDPIIKRLQSVGTTTQGRSPINATHQCGSCRAGVDRKNSVFNQRFECHDIKNLLIGGDLSVSPRVTYGNPGICMCAHISCFAWRRIVQDHFSKPSLGASKA